LAVAYFLGHPVEFRPVEILSILCFILYRPIHFAQKVVVTCVAFLAAVVSRIFVKSV